MAQIYNIGGLLPFDSTYQTNAISGPELTLNEFGGGGSSMGVTIKQPINSFNYPRTPKNVFGLRKTKSLPIISLSDLPKPKTLIEKLDEGVSDVETIDIESRSIDLIINVVDEVSVSVPDVVEITYPKVVRGADFVGYDTDFNIKWNSVNTTFIKLFIGNSTDFVRLSPKGSQSFNVKELLERYGLETYDDGDKIKIPLRLKPVNEESKKPVEGPTEEIPIVFDKGDIDIPRSVALNRIAEGFISQFERCAFDDTNFLTHLLHLGDGDNKIITTWRGLKESTDSGADASSLILKLYEPLPVSVSTNQKVFVTKLQTDPLIETITMVGDGADYCPPLQGPNFTLEPDNGIGYQVYDDLLGSGSATTTSLLQEYITRSDIDTRKLNIAYASGSDTVPVYNFDEFSHFGSVEERIKNFWYKLELLETYQAKYNSLSSTTEVELGYLLAEGSPYDGFVIVTEASESLSQETVFQTAAGSIEAIKQLDKINEVIGSFDGFEHWLYTDTEYSSSLSYPKSGNTIVATTTSDAIAWYNSSKNLASKFDKDNVNYLNNNLPEFIKEDYQNQDFMLFMDMIGHHFDILWVYINTLTKVKKLNQHATRGFANDLVYNLLESLGWDGRKAFDSQFLWEYAFGKNKDGTVKTQQSLKSANEEVWRRILNNLPYLLKHKGTSRSLKAVMASYGVPQSLLTIMEFGGPTDPTDGGTQPFTFDDRTAAINFTNQGEYVYADWQTTDGTKPNSVELTVNLQNPGDYNLVKVGGFTLDSNNGQDENWRLSVEQTTGSFGKVNLYVSGSEVNELYSASTPQFKIFNDEYTQIVVNRTETNSTSSFQVIAKEAFDGRIRTDVSSTALEISGQTKWDSGSLLYLGYGMTASLDEFRLWKTPLEDGVIEIHTLQPDSIAGNNHTASSEDLWVRFDFEYPKDRTNDNNLLNVAISEEYALTYGTAVGFPSSSAYPYQYIPYERRITAKVPSLGFNQADKIRFESQTLVSDLSHKVRATKKSLDQAPVDSSRLGLFFSPIKELNMDIIKSFGNFNIDNYIGDPSDEYRDEYRELSNLREYYFQRLNRDIYEYIRLVRYIDKSLFDVLEDLVPARAKVSKGLLIEPHYLERSKTKWTKPTSEKRDYETSIDVDEDVNLTSENTQYDVVLDAEEDLTLSHQYDNYDANIDAEEDVVLISTNPQYDSSIDIDEDIEFIGTYPTYNVSVDAGVSEPTLGASIHGFEFEQIGMEKDSLANAGYGLYASLPATGSVTKLDIFGNLFTTREQIYLIKERYIEKVEVQTEGYPATSNNEQVKYELQDVTKFRYKVSRVAVGTTPPSVGNDIVEVTPLNGYFPTHYKYKNNLSQGLKNSFFDGSKQTATTTPDGLDPVETFTTNPNILRVADTGRGSGEPILEVD